MMKTRYWHTRDEDGLVTGWGFVQAKDAPLPEGARPLYAPDYHRLDSMNPVETEAFMTPTGLELRPRPRSPELDQHRVAQNLPALLASLHAGLASDPNASPAFRPFLDLMDQTLNTSETD